MANVMDKRVNKVGDYLTLHAVAVSRDCTPNAVYKWIRYNNIPHILVGRTVLVRQNYIVGYVPRDK